MPRVSLAFSTGEVLGCPLEGTRPDLDEQFDSLSELLKERSGSLTDDIKGAPVVMSLQQSLCFGGDDPSGLWVPADWVRWVARAQGSIEVHLSLH